MKVAPEGLPIVAAVGLSLVAWIAILALGFDLPATTWVLALLPPSALLLFSVWFFRDPERRPPGDPLALLSPADGKVLRVDATSVSVFMNVFDVHVCRTPMAGRVASVEHVPGRFVAAYKDAASEQNERARLVVRNGALELVFTLVAGLVARRIVCRVEQGQDLVAGQRIGVIRFGSRVDVVLPPGSVPAVGRGQRVVAGSTVIARLPDGGMPRA